MAAEGGRYYDESFVASTGLTTNQFYIVRSTSKDGVLLCTGSSMGAARARGVLQNNPASGEAATVRLWGKTKVVAGGSITIEDPITASTAGTALSATTTGALVCGFANEASTAAGSIIEVFWTGPAFIYNSAGTA